MFTVMMFGDVMFGDVMFGDMMFGDMMFLDMVFLLHMGMTDLVYYGVKTVVLVGGVMNDTGRAVGFLERVRAFDYVTVAVFRVLFLISGVGIFYGVIE